MTKLTFLHLSDLHWSTQKSRDQKILIDGLAADLKLVKREHRLTPDLTLFTGDLVLAGEDDSAFASVKAEFVDKVIEATGLTPDKFVISPGNHDIMRKVVREADYIENGLKSKLTTVDALNSFIDGLKNPESKNAYAIERMANFNNALPHLSSAVPCLSTPLVCVYTYRISEVRIAVASFNTAWRATGEDGDRDRQSLLLGERNVDDALSAMGDAEIRVAMLHHPFEWLAEFDEAAVSSRIISHFDFVMCGHTHKNSPEARTTSVGTAIFSQCGCLYESRKFFNGYQFITVDLQNQTVEFFIRTWFDTPRREFDAANNIAKAGKVCLPFVLRNQGANKVFVDSFLREVRPIIREAATKHISIAETSGQLKFGAKDAFICPPLSLRKVRPEIKGVEDAFRDQDGNKVTETKITAEEILRSDNNYCVVGQREAGKSSLAHYMAVMCAEGVCDRQRIPVYIDYRQLRGMNIFGLKKAIAAYFGATNKGIDTEDCLQKGDFLFLLDTFSGQQKQRRKEMEALIQSFPENRWIFFVDMRHGGLDPKNETADLLPNFKVVSIQALPRKAIRELAERWCEQTGNDNEKTFTAVMRQLKDGGLPRTGYIVTLLLWAVYKERNFERLNEAVLLMNIVDFLLGKADFTKALQKEFDPTSSEITLQSIAVFLRRRGGFCTMNELLAFIIEFFEQKGLSYNASAIIHKFVECGLLVVVENDVSFKYRCFQEYFYAGYLKNNASALEEHLNGPDFTEFSRELELLAGIRRQNSDLIKTVSLALQNLAPETVATYQPSDFDEVTAAESTLGITFAQIRAIRKKKLTVEQIDDMMDEAERNLSERRSARRSPPGAVSTSPTAKETNSNSAEHMNFFQYLSAVYLLGSIVRNSEFTDASEKATAVRLFLSCNMKITLLYFSMISELISGMQGRENSPISSENDAKATNILFRQLLIGMNAELASEHIGTEKLANVYETIMRDATSTFFEKLFVCMFMLDIFHPRWLDYWNELIDECKKKNFALKLLIDKVWRMTITRKLELKERKRIEEIADRIETIFGQPKHLKGRLLESIRTHAGETSKRLDTGE